MQLIESFKQFLLSQRNPASAVTVKNYVADVRKFVLWFEQHFSKAFAPQEVTLQTVEIFKASISQSEGSVKSIERYQSSLRKFFRFLKLESVIATDPFEAETKPQAPEDPLHLKSFKNFLYVYNASGLTMKNYLIDIKQFFTWAEQVMEDAANASEVLAKITPEVIKVYQERLFSEHAYSPASINRKLSSLRKYFAWAIEQGIVTQNPFEAASPVQAHTTLNLDAVLAENIQGKVLEKSQIEVEYVEKAYSAIPPIRLIQKTLSGFDFLLEKIIITPTAKVINLTHTFSWHAQGKPIFSRKAIITPAKGGKEAARGIHNFPKALYSPITVSLTNFPWYKKVMFHVRFTRPNWYKKYHSYAISHYFNLAVLFIFCVIVGAGMYSVFISGGQKSPTLAAAPASPLRILSFQGRLTDNNDNPITTTKSLRFTIYSDASSSGSARLWEETQSISPDQDGIFSVLLGSNGSGGNAALCNGGNPPTSPPTGPCGIPQSLFAQNAQLWLGVAVETGSELTPRQQLATVAYASNAETLQGLPPITDSSWISAGSNANAVLALGSNGVVNIAGSANAVTVIQASDSNIKITGNVTTLTTNTGTNGNIEFIPDGSGWIDAQKPFFNSTLNSNLRSGTDNASSSAGAVEVDDLFAVLATSSGQSAVTINQDGVGPIISASHSGLPVFTVDSSGNTTIAGNIALSSFGNLGGIVYQANSSGQLGVSTPGSAGECLVSGGAGAPGWITCNLAATNWWNQANGAVYAINSTTDLLVGGNSTASAKFGLLNVDSGTPTASVSAGTTGALYITAAGKLATTAKQDITVGDSATSGNVNFFSSANSINSNGNLTLGGTISLPNNNTITGVTNFTNFSNGVGFGAGNTTPTYFITSTGDANLANLFLPVTGGTDGFFQLANNVIAPSNTINDLAIGGNSTASAKFQVFGATGNATTAGTLTFNTTGSIQTTNNQNLTIGGNTTGNINLNPLNTVVVNGGLNVTGAFQLSGLSTGIVHSSSNGTFSSSAVNLATSDVTGILPLANGGTNANLTANQGGIVYSTNSELAISAAGSSGQCLISGGTSAPSWIPCAAGSNTNWWNVSNGSLYSINDTVDLLIGGSASSSAKFAVLGVNGTTTTASVSGQTGSAYLTNDGTLATSNSQTLTIGNGTTGNIVLSPLNNVTITGLGTGVVKSTNGVLSSSAVNVATADITGVLPVVNGGTGLSTIPSGALVYGNGTGNANTLAAATTGNVLVSDGTNPTYTTALTGLTQLTSSGTIQFSGLSTGIVHASSNGTLSSSAVNLATSDVTGVLPLANGGTNANLTVNQGGIVYSNNAALAISAAGTQNQVLISNGTNAPSFTSDLNVNNIYLPVTGGTGGFWQLANNVIAPSNLASDLAIGGNSTASAKFQVFSNGNATTSGTLTFNNVTGNIQTTNFKNLNLGGSTTGQVVLSGFNGTNNGITFQGYSTGLLHADSNGTLTSSAVNLATSDVTGVLPLANGGTNANLTVNQGGIVYSNNAALAISAAGTAGQCLISGGTNTPTWTSCAAGSSTNWWNVTNGALYAINSTTDLLVGGNASSSAKFAVLGVNGTTTTASVSGQTGSVYLTNDGTLATSNSQTLTLGGANTGNIVLNPLAGVTINGTLRVTGATTLANLSTGLVHADSNGTLTSSTVNLATADVTGLLPLANGGTNANLTANQGGIVYSTNSELAISAAGTAGQCLISGGTNTPIWDQCAAGVNYFSQTNGALYPSNPTTDLLVGGNSTASAKFAFINVNNGTPTASISAGTNGATFITADGNLQTTASQTLTLGGGNTGNIILNPLTGVTDNGTLTVTGTTRLSALSTGIAHVSSNGTLSSSAVNLATSDVTGVLPLANGGTNNGSLTAVAGGVIYSTASGFDVTAAGNSGYCLVSGGAGTPSFAQCATGTNGVNYWTLQNGALNTINNTADLLVGGTATNSAKFAVLGVNTTTTTASVSGQTGSSYLTNDGTLATTARQTLTLGNSSTTGNIVLNPLSTVTITGLGTGIVRSTNGTLSSSAVNLATSDVTGVLPLANGGTNANLTANQGGIVYSTNSELAISAAGSLNQCLVSGGTNAPSWSSCALGVNWWNVANGTVYPINNTLDLLIGGTSTDSAKFAVLGVNGTTTTASVSGQTGSAYLTNDGTLATTNSQTLTLGNGSTGNIVLNPLTGVTDNGTLTVTGTTRLSALSTGIVHSSSNGTLSSSAVNLATTDVTNVLPVNHGGTGLSTLTSGALLYGNGTNNVTLLSAAGAGNVLVSDGTNPTYTNALTGLTQLTSSGTIQFSGLSTGIVHASSNGTLSSAAVNLATSDVTGVLPLANGGTNANLTANQGGIVYSGGSALAISAAGSTGECLASNGTNAPSWLTCAFGTNWWNEANGAVSPINSTLDLLVGGNSTGSAIFAVTGATSTGANSYPTASVSATTGNFAGNGIILGANGSIQSLQNNNLTIGGATTGNIALSPLNGAGIVTVNGLLNAPTIQANNIFLPVTGGTDGFFQLSNNVIAPSNTINDLAVGGNSTASAKFQVFGATGNATTTGTLTFNTAGSIQTTKNQNLTIGGTSTGNITLSPLNGVAGSNLTLNAATITIPNGNTITGVTNFAQFNGGVSVGGATTYNINANTSRLNSLQLDGNVYQPVTGGISGFWQLASNVIAPSNTINDLAVGGNSTSSAKFQVYGATGNATTSGTFTFNTAGQLQTTNMQNLTIGGSSTGKIILSGLNNANNGITFQGYSTGILHADSNGTLSSSAVNLATSDVTGVLPLANGGTNANLTANAGGIVYSDASKFQILAGTATAGECLVSGSSSAPSWQLCATGANGTNYWASTLGAIYPSNSTFDLFVGGTSTDSAKFAVLNMNNNTPVASVSAQNGNGQALVLGSDETIQTVKMHNLTLGGSNTGNIILSPLNGSGTVTVNGTGITSANNSFDLLNSSVQTLNFGGAATALTMGASTGTTTINNALQVKGTSLTTNQASFTLLDTPTTINFGAGATTAFNIGSSSGPIALKGNTTIGNSNTNTVTVNALLNQDLLPTAGGTINLGSAANPYNVVYANAFSSPTGNGVQGFWTVTNNTNLYPTNTADDLLVGGTGTGSASFQIFSSAFNNGTSVLAGTATTSGSLSFRGSGTQFNLLNGTGLDIKSSVGGDDGLASILTINNNGNVTFAGSSIDDTTTNVTLFNTPTTLTLGGSAATFTLGANNSGYTEVRNELRVDQNYRLTGNLLTSILPNATSLNLGSTSKYFGSLFVNNISVPANGVDGYWQMNSQVLAPQFNVSDLAIGGTATGSATPFQIFANAFTTDAGTTPAGTASTSGNLTFRGTAGSQTGFKVNLLNDANLGFYNSVGGNLGINTANPALLITNTGRIGLGTASPLATLDISGSASLSGSLSLRGATTGHNINLLQGGTLGIFTSVGGDSGLAANPSLFISSNVNGLAGSVGINTNTLLSTFDVRANTYTTPVASISGATGKATLVIDQSGVGDIFTASNAGSTKFTIANDGTIRNSLIPFATDAYNLGSDPSIGGKEWDTLYVRQIVTPANGGIAGFWQLSNGGVLAPANTTNDLVIGGNSTASAKFQVYANSFTNDSRTNPVGLNATLPGGTASMSGDLVFTNPGTSNIRILNGGNLSFYGSVGGDKGLGSTQAAPILSIINHSTNTDRTANGSVLIGIGNQYGLQNSLASLEIATENAIHFSGGNGDVGGYIDTTRNNELWLEGGAQYDSELGYQIAKATSASSVDIADGSIYFNTDSGLTAGGTFTGTERMRIDTLGKVAIGNILAGNGQLVLNQTNNAGLGDIFAASSSGTTRFIITNDGTVGIGKNMSDFAVLPTSGLTISKDSRTNALVALNQLSTAGSPGDFLTASDSAGLTRFRIDGSGNVFSGKFVDINNVSSTYFLDPAATGNSMIVAGSVGIANTNPRAKLDITGSASISANLDFAGIGASHTVNIDDGGNLGFYTSVGGTSVSSPSLYIASGTSTDFGKVGIGTTTPSTSLQVAGDFQVGKDATAWMSSPNGYTYRRQVTINNTSGSALINYQMKIVVDTATLISAGKIQNSSCNDVRFTDTDGTTTLNYWIEPNTCNTNATTFWVKVPSIPGPNKMIYMYYGAAGQSAVSSATNTFIREITGVQAAWRLDEPTYLPINDFSGNGNNVATASGTSSVTGKFNNARSFNGTSDYLEVNDSASLRITQPLSVAIWFKKSANPGAKEIMIRKDTAVGSSTRSLYGLNFLTSGKVEAEYYNNPTDYIVDSTASSYADGSWHYAVMTISGTTMTLYVDGVSTGTPTTVTIGGAPNGYMDIGAAPPELTAARTSFFSGSLDAPRVYNVALSQAQITDLYNNHGYVLASNANTEEVNSYVSTAPTVGSLGQEQNSLQLLPAFYVQQTTGNVALGTSSVSSTSALLTVAGDIKSGLYDPTSWIASGNGESYRTKITVDNTNSASSSANADYQVQVTTNTSTLISAGKMRSDCNDVRFTDSDGQTSLSYWMESGCNSTSTLFWVKVPQLPPGQKKNIYMYYGNSSLSTSVSSSANTFVRSISGLQAAYKLDDTNGTDSSGNGNTGTVTASNDVGMFNNSLTFNGTGNNISITSASSINFTNTMSADFWVKPAAIQATSADIFSKHNLLTSGGYMLESTGTGNTYFFGWSTGAGGVFVCNQVGGSAGQWGNGGIVLTPNVWQHVAVTKSGTSAVAYVNGVQVSTCTGSSATIGTNSNALKIAQFSNSNTHFFKGSLDEMHFYNTALTAAEVYDLANPTATPHNGYSTTNSANTIYVRSFTNPEPTASIDTEQDQSQVDPTLYVNNTYNRVGINTANPLATLDLTGNNTNTLVTFNQTGTGDLLDLAVNGTSAFHITNAGNVGIGTTSPAANLHIGTYGSNGLLVGNSSDLGSNSFAMEIAMPSSTSTWPFGIIQNGTPLFRISSSGNVGIGSQTPAYALDVDGTISTGGSAGGGTIRIRPNGAGSWFWIDNDNVSRLRFSDGGSAGSHFDMSINSNATITVNTTNYTSDQRLKKNIQNLDTIQGLDAIRKLRPVSFNWKDVASDPNLQLGFIAQDIQQTFPELVETTDDTRTITLPDGTTQTILNPLGLNYTGLIAPLVLSVQQLDASISAQQSQLSYLQNLQFTTTGNIFIAESTPSADFTIPHYYTIADAMNNPLKQMGAFLELVVGNLRVGSLFAQQTITNTLAVTTDKVSIAGQSLHDYVAGIVTDILDTKYQIQNTGTTSPISQNGTISANVITPLATGSAVTVNGKLVVTGDTTATTSSRENIALDVQGSASIAGTLNASQLAVNGDATVSGTLHADKIEANSIVGLSAILSTLSAQNITNVTNITFASPSSSDTSTLGENSLQNISSTNSGVLNASGSGQLTNGYLDVTSFSALLGYVPQLRAAIAQFDQGLMSLGPTSLSDTSITGTLSIGSQMILADNTLNVLGTDLEIQPLKQGGVDFLAGAVKINNNGDLTVNGKAVFNGGIYASVISPLAGQDLNVILSDSEGSSQKFNIKNSSGSAVFAVNSVGDILASGAATISKLNLNPVQTAQALSATEIVATSSAGTAVVNTFQKEITIDTPFVTDKSLIYITPVGNDSNQTPYLLRQVPGHSFTVGVNVPTSVETKFNWLIIN